jgi:hypothetical protein
VTKIVIVGAGTRPKLRPRGKPFKKGKRQPFQFWPEIRKFRLQAEDSSDVDHGVRPPARSACSHGDRRQLGRYPREAIGAEVIARAIVSCAASDDISAAKDLAERTGRHVPAAVSEEARSTTPLGKRPNIVEDVGAHMSVS